MPSEDRRSLAGHFPCAWKCQGRLILTHALSLLWCFSWQVSPLLCWAGCRAGSSGSFVPGPRALEHSAAHCCAPVNRVPLSEMTAGFTEQLCYCTAEVSGGEGASSSAAGILMVLAVPVAYPCWFWKLAVPPFHSACASPDSWNRSCLPCFLYLLVLRHIPIATRSLSSPPSMSCTLRYPLLFVLPASFTSPHTPFPVHPRRFYPPPPDFLLHRHALPQP